jgi:fatty acid desaturase
MTFWRLFLVLFIPLVVIGVWLVWWLRAEAWPRDERTKWDDEFRKTGSDQ